MFKKNLTQLTKFETFFHVTELIILFAFKADSYPLHLLVDQLLWLCFERQV